MKNMNLRKLYPFYPADQWIEVPDEIADAMKGFDLMENAFRLRTYRHKAYYSLDRNDGIENEMLFVSLSPQELYERKVTKQELYAALYRLPEKQAKRIYAHYFLGMSKVVIAKVEQVNERAIRKSIERGLMQMEKYLKRL
ncbi:RNA polymerase sigma factor [Paenibacillus glucanolyticus]|uniref:RNA polymerase sigma factor n=1 Tax=Paenibacillus glucanolyticus TaxID=59843 RepID=UPI00128DB54F|nr:sigma factor-like helix-turn-helix DNA-binding protein [Paenibacillus glucanolyticus]MPY19897.1 sigma-70 family RNA polymerase sigma factor [Paenibacillus glucanolyticus]